MRRSLTCSSRSVNGRYCNRYEYEGAEVDVCDSALTAVLLAELFADEGLEPAEKEALFPAMVLADPGAALAAVGAGSLWDMLAAVSWDAFGLDLLGEHSCEVEEPVFDWAEDAGRIRASLLQAYGLSWDEAAPRTSYADMCDLLAGLMESGETPLQQAVLYRTAEPPRETRYNRDLVEAFRAKREHYRLRRETSPADAAEAANDAMASAFMGEWAAAERAAGKGAGRG